jgi:hypothetical protein
MRARWRSISFPATGPNRDGARWTVVSSDASRTLLNSGVIDYFYVENALASVRTPVFVD